MIFEGQAVISEDFIYKFRAVRYQERFRVESWMKSSLTALGDFTYIMKGLTAINNCPYRNICDISCF